MKYLLLTMLILFSLVGCSSTTVHYSKISDDSYLYWVEREHLFTPNHVQTVSLVSNNSSNTVLFERTKDEFIFFKRPSDDGDIDGVCGKVSIGSRIKISIWCKHKPNPFNHDNSTYPLIIPHQFVDIQTCSKDNTTFEKGMCKQ